jgi:polynucleotide 5'-hydroxyl-kinase GRC3/NOL9
MKLLINYLSGEINILDVDKFIMHFPSDWEEALERIIFYPKPVKIFILGGVDSGKTTLATYLANGLYKNFKVALVDADIGQSSIGPPTVIGMGFFEGDLSDVKMEDGCFIGATSPAFRRDRCINGTKRLVEKAIKSSDVVLIDTTGFLDFEFKIAKIKAIQPDLIFALPRRNELEDILSPFSGVHRLSIPEVRVRSLKERKVAREKAFTRYFKSGKLIGLPSEVEIIGEISDGHLLGIFADEKFVGLGIAEKVADKLRIFTPADKISRIEVGVVKLRRKGNDIRES